MSARSKVIPFSVPQLSKCKIKQKKSYQAPYRKEGMRILHEKINGKNIVHNYGHGSSGVILAYGSAYIAVKALMIKVDINKSVDVAVIGGGINGVMTGIEMLKRGFKVSLYSEESIKATNILLQNEDKARSMGYSMWMPDGYDYAEDLLKHELVSKLSFDYLTDCIRTKKYRSISEVSVIDINKSVDELKEVVSEFIFDTFKNIQIQYQNGQQQEAVNYNTLIVDNTLYFEELKTQFILRGGKFIQKKISSISDVTSLKESAIINCLGNSSKRIFGDQNMEPKLNVIIDLVQTQSAIDEPEKGELKDWFIRLHLENGSNYQVMRRGKNIKILLPIPENSEENVQQYAQKHLNALENYFEARQIVRAKL